MWSIGRYDLGLTDAEFWHLTLRQYNSLFRRFLADQERQDLRAARICWVTSIGLHVFDESDEPFEVRDFVPSPADPDDGPKEMDPEQAIIRIRALNMAFGGRETS